MIPREEVVEKLVAAVREVAAEKPDHVYQTPANGTCAYVLDGQPSCIVGQAAWRLGLIDGSFEKHIEENTAGVTTFLRYLGAAMDEDNEYEREFLDAVQEKQDQEVAWGEAVELADARAQAWTV